MPNFKRQARRHGSKIKVVVELNGAQLVEWVNRPELIPGAMRRAENDLIAAAKIQGREI